MVVATSMVGGSQKTTTLTLEVQDQTKNGLWDDPCKGFPTINGQSLVFGLPGLT